VKDLELSTQIYKLMDALNTMNGAAPESKTKIFDWVRDVSPAARPDELYTSLARVFKMTVEDVRREVDPSHTRPNDFDDLVPRKGWIADYVDFTRNTEPPTVFHFFAGMMAVSSALSRNLYYDMGPYQLFPNLCVVIVAPSGRCKKTSACQIAVNMMNGIGINVLADKLTPEVLVESLKDKNPATGLLYAPELAAFLGKQKYQEGMVPMLTRLMDCPDVWKSATIMRGDAELRNVALTFLGASTLDWIQTEIPKSAFGGGFISRLLFVVQEDTPRSFPLPPEMDKERRYALMERLRLMTQIRGKVMMSSECRDWYISWYTSNQRTRHENKQFSGYYERKPDHAMRLAMLLNVSEGGNHLEMQRSHLQHAVRILDWIEAWLPGTFDSLQESTQGAALGGLIKQLKSRQGGAGHSELLRLNSKKMNALTFKQTIETGVQAGLIIKDAKSGKYLLTADGWKQ
jgi:hypothetical protein